MDYELGTAIAATLLGAAALGYALGRTRRAEGGTESTVAGGPPGEDPPLPSSKTPPDRVHEDADRELLKVVYDEEDDELDLTKVGAGASGHPESKARIIYQPPVVKIMHDLGADESGDSPSTPLFFVHATAQTDRGARRKKNEDSLLVLESEFLFAVADGMGGYEGGELASQLAIETLAKATRAKDFEGPPHVDLPLEASELARAIQMANAEIQELAATRPELKGMGTTVCAARFAPTRKRLYVGHVGDSRCYRLREGVFKLMTADHTMADLGLTGPESAALSRAVGIWPTMPIDIVMAVPEVEDVYLLCSDGLTKMLPDETIGNVVRAEDDPKAAVERLILFANAHGGKDNITVVLVRVVPPNWKPRSQSRPGA